MNFLFTSNHVQLLKSCYPPTSALITSGPDYSPNSQELSRLTYHASNHPAKLTKLGSEIEKQVKSDARKARTGNLRSRASLLISLAILKALASECRRDIALLSPALVSCVEMTVSSLPSDLEVLARAATVFTAWATYTNGHLVGTDSGFTNDYLSVLRNFAALCCQEGKDKEVRNKARLLGFATLSAVISSEALYNDTAQFKAQVSILMRPILSNILQAELRTHEREAEGVKNSPVSSYLSEFRSRPAIERRPASIHIHITGDKGPSSGEVSASCLRALFSLLQHVNGSQLGHIMRSSFDNLDTLNGWTHLDHCCWFARKTAEWAQYQYRYVVPTWLIDRIVEAQDSPKVTPMHKALIDMASSVFNSPIPLINISTSDIITNLLTLVTRRISIDSEDALLPDLVQCISSLGSHIYYSDQVQDLAFEIIQRLMNAEQHGILPRASPSYSAARSQTIRSLIAGLIGLLHAAEGSAHLHYAPEQTRKRSGSTSGRSPSLDGSTDRRARRTRISPEFWQETLSLLCDDDFAVRADYADALIYYIESEMPKYEESENDGASRIRKLESPMQQAMNATALRHAGDIGTKFLNAIHAYVYLWATTCKQQSTNRMEHPEKLSSPISSNGIDLPQVNVQPATPSTEPKSPPSAGGSGSHSPHDRTSINWSPTRSQKLATMLRLFEEAPLKLTSCASACLADYGYMSRILQTVYQLFPVHGLLTGAPMLIALDEVSNVDKADDQRLVQRQNVVKLVLRNSWSAIAKAWGSAELSNLVEKSGQPEGIDLPPPIMTEMGTYHPPLESIIFPDFDSITPWRGVDARAAIQAIAASENVQNVTGLDEASLTRRLGCEWHPKTAFKASFENFSYDATFRGDGVSPLLKISPALMQIDNMSLISLSRANRAVGVTDLRDALEGRSSMSTTALGNSATSISTLDRASEFGGDTRLVQTRSRTKSKKLPVKPGTTQVGDVLTKLGIGKSNGSLLKSSFSPLQKQEQRTSPY